ncbi:MAG: nuclear transport factor 2 family protein [Gammaproteobacteria bacterium]|nr:nuclear transport factor 2 family protein [Gammaproteobacteria bacterium]MBA3732327.1 nuclear transport factor 2 family protein [Gammaproteobacteria bacterium]
MSTATPTATPTSETEIRALIDSWLKAVHAQDIAGIVSDYAPDILAFDAIAKLQFKGREAYQKHWEACLAMCPGPGIFEMHDLQIAAGEDVAFAHCLNWCGGTDANGEEKASWMRMTAGYRKINGKWAVVHEHWSAPFDMESGKALFDLKP